MSPSDPYAWIDPFEEVERARTLASHAREDGRRDILRAIEERREGAFARALYRATERCAMEIAEQIVKPHMAKNYVEYEQMRKLSDLRLRDLTNIAKPVLHNIAAQAKEKLGYRDYELDEAILTMTVTTIRPFQYSVSMSPIEWW